MSVLGALALCRAATFDAALFLFGAFAYLAVLVPKPLSGEIAAALGLARVAAAVALLLATIALLPVTAASVGDGWQDALSWSVTHDLLLETDAGTAWMLRAVAALVLLAVSLAASRPGRTALAAAVIVATLPLAGHAAMQDGALGALHRLADVLHLAAAGAWLGSLVPLLLILVRMDRPGRLDAARGALKNFSRAGYAAVAVILATGALNTLLTLGRVPLDPASPYQRLLAAKIGLVIAMLGLAAVNRFLLVPRLKRQGTFAARALRATTAAEIIIGVTVVALVAVFGLLDPA
jgi:putative copper resistance protein D